MSESDDRTEDAGTEDESSEEVRRLLADARVDEPMPADVQTRLEEVLAQLSSERSAAGAAAQPLAAITESSQVVDLSTRRRRRAKTLLIAAAAVTVIGVGISQLQGGLSGQMDAATSESAADDSAAGDSAARDSAESDAGGVAGLDEESADGPEAAPDAPSEPANASAVPPRIRPGSFPADAEAVRDQAARSDFKGFPPLDPNCLAGTELTADRLTESRSVPVRYVGLDAVLVLGRERNGSQEATLYVCGESSPRRTTLLAPR